MSPLRGVGRCLGCGTPHAHCAISSADCPTVADGALDTLCCRTCHHQFKWAGGEAAERSTMAAEEQPDELAAARAGSDFLPGGAGWEAWQKVILDKVHASFDLPEGLTLEWEQIAPIDLAQPAPFDLNLITGEMSPRSGTVPPYCYKERRFGPWVHVDNGQPCRCK